MEQKNTQYEAYLSATHKLGRWLTVLVLVLLLAAPFAIGAYLGAMPNLGAAVKAFLGVGLVYLVSGIVEYLIYVPMLAAGVILMIPLQPVLQSPTLQPAFENVVPALFGAMACKYYRMNRVVALIVLAFMSLLFILVPGLIGSTSMMVIPSGALAIVLAYLAFRRQQKKGGSL